ncbi:hypothetical protein BJ912DRAFT_400365 [Pholiota molesta]|nr:hypothetical protein BJ912DRAFT_400365 [Pholiota molesta]
MSWIRSSLLRRNPPRRRKKRLLQRSPSRLTERRPPRLLLQRRIHLLRLSWLHLPRSQMKALLPPSAAPEPTKRWHPSNLHNPLQLPSQPNQPQRNLSLLSLPLTRNILQPTPMPIHKPHTLMRHTTLPSWRLQLSICSISTHAGHISSPSASRADYPPQPAMYNNMMPVQHPPQHEGVAADDLPSYEEMIVEALTGCADPEGWAPKDLFTWMASRYPVQSNFRPSASQALQKAFKRGRFEKSSNGKYRLNVTWNGGNTSRRTTRRPQTQNSQSTSGSSAPAPPFTNTPLVHHHHGSTNSTHPPATSAAQSTYQSPPFGYSYPPHGYPGYSAQQPQHLRRPPQAPLPERRHPTPPPPRATRPKRLLRRLAPTATPPRRTRRPKTSSARSTLARCTSWRPRSRATAALPAERARTRRARRRRRASRAWRSCCRTCRRCWRVRSTTPLRRR